MPRKLDLKDTTFLIIVRIDSKERYENLETVTRYITCYFETNVLILEADKTQQAAMDNRENVQYQFVWDEDDIFHSTKYRNMLLKQCTTKYFVNYDTDVILPFHQIKEGITVLRENKAEFVFPYDGRFYNIHTILRKLFIKKMSTTLLSDHLYLGNLWFPNSVGGVCMSNTAIYRQCGWENENIHGWGPDDKERFQRVKRLNYTIQRIPGPLFHLHHPRDANSFFANQHIAIKNQIEYLKICSMPIQQLQQYVGSWKWTK